MLGGAGVKISVKTRESWQEIKFGKAIDQLKSFKQITWKRNLKNFDAVPKEQDLIPIIFVYFLDLGV